jgi:hypothetical protein
MSEGRELEAQVMSLWNAGVRSAFCDNVRDPMLASIMEVYSDALQKNGDPRGELIALDSLSVSTSESELRRRELHLKWLGNDLGQHPDIISKYGLLQVVASDEDPGLLSRLFAVDGRAHIEGITVFGGTDLIRTVVMEIAAETLPWLNRLRFIVVDDDRARVGGFILTHSIAARLIASTPALYAMNVSGIGFVRHFCHPSLLSLVVNGYDAIGSLSDPDAPGFPGVMELDFAFHAAGDRIDPVEDTIQRLLPAGHFPSLRRLDLSRNEPGYAEPRHLGGNLRIFELLNRLELSSRLTHLRLPSLRSPADAEHLQSALDRMPNLMELRVSRSYGSRREIVHPSATLRVPPPRAWPAPDEVSSRHISVHLSDDLGSFNLHLAEGVAAMEGVYDQLPTEAREAWNALWTAISDEHGAGRTVLPMTTLALALDSCLEMLHSDGWRRLASTLRGLDARTLSASALLSRGG